MVSFRKAFLLLAALVVITGVVSAQTPATCQAYTSNVPTVRAEGIAEEVGQVVIECIGGTSKTRGTALYPNNIFNLQIYLNTNVTSRRTTSSSSSALEALLLIDEPTIPQVTSGRVCSAANAASTPLPAVCQATAVGGGIYYDSVIVNPNVFQGRLVTNNSILWTGIPFDAPGSTPKRIFRVVNVRANASALAPGSALIPGAIQMFISVSGTAAPQLTNSQLTVAYVQDGMQFRAGAGSSSDNGKSYLQCEVSDGSFGSASVQKFRLRYTERFPTAFEDANLPTGNQADLTRFYNTEHMYYHPSVNDALGGLPGLALDQLGQRYVPTRLLANFTNIPTNVRLRVPTQICSTSGNECFQFVLCTDNTGSVCSTTTIASGSSVSIDNIVGGVASIVYEMYSSNSTNIADVSIPVELRWGPNSSLPGPPGTGTVTVQGSYAPTSTTFTATTGPTPRFVIDPADVVTFVIAPCRTNLLFPYVTNQGGFDTGLVIANTSADKFGTVPQNGTCTLDYFGTTGASGAAPASITTETVNAGSLLIGTLQFGGNLGLPAAKEFAGYIIAKCNFQYAHGFAYLYSGPTFEGSMGYLALVLDSDKGVITGTIDGTSITLNPPSSRTGSISEARNN